jgi:hypothetical protein
MQGIASHDCAHPAAAPAVGRAARAGRLERHAEGHSPREVTASAGSRRPRRAAWIRLLQAVGAGGLSVLLLAIAVQGAWNANVLASSRSAVEASEGEEATTPTAIQRVRGRRPRSLDSASPARTAHRFDDALPLRLAWTSTPVAVDSRSGRQRVHLLRHLLI